MGKWYEIAGRKHRGENQLGRCDKGSILPFQGLNSPLHDLSGYCNGEGMERET